MAGLFSTIGGTLENGFSTYVTGTSSALSGALVPVVTTALTLWVLAYGFALMRAEVHEPIPAFAWRAVRIALILAIALGEGVYQRDVVTGSEGATSWLAQTIQQAGNGVCANGVSAQGVVSGQSAAAIYGALDCYDLQASGIAAGYIRQAADDATSLHISAAVADVLFAMVSGTGMAIFEIVMMFEVLLARAMNTLVLGLGPLFIACAAFEPSRRFFDAWVSKVVNYALLQVLVAAFLGMAFSAFSALISPLTGGNATIGSIQSYVVAQIQGDQLIVDAFAMLVTGVLLAMIGWQLPAVTAGLAGGASISGFGAFAAGMASRALPGAAGKAIDRLRDLGKQGDGGSITPGGGGGGSSGGRSGAGNAAKPAYQRANLDQLNRAGADGAT